MDIKTVYMNFKGLHKLLLKVREVLGNWQKIKLIYL